MLLGRQQVTPAAGVLIPLYIEACKGPQLDERVAGHWERQIFSLDSRTFLIMARLTRDPMPWQPFLYLLDVYVDKGYALEVVRSHLLSVAQDLLNLQGLELVKPRDVMRSPLLIKVRLAAISRRGGNDAEEKR